VAEGRLQCGSGSFSNVFRQDFCLVPLTFAEGQGYIVQKKLRDIRCLMEPKHRTRLFFYKMQEWVDIPQSSFTVNEQMQLSYQLLDYYLDEEI